MEEYVGRIIERAIRRQDVSISELSRRMNVSRRTLYNCFERRTLDKNFVCSIGTIIGYDFTKELGVDFNNENHQAENVCQVYPALSENELEDQKETDYWMQKYIQLLEKYNQLLQKVVI